MPNDEIYVALLGSVQSGKTALIPSLERSALYAHGLPHDVQIQVKEDMSAFSADAASGNVAQADRPRKRKLAEARERAFRGIDFVQDPTLYEVVQYPMHVTARRRTNVIERKVRIIDSGGGVMLPSETARRQQAREEYSQAGVESQRKAALVNLLHKEVVGIVFCIDITQDDASKWESSFRELVEDIVRRFEVGPGRPRRRIALTFTKTDQLFMLDGMDAAKNALTRRTLLERLNATFESGAKKMLRVWHELERDEAKRIEIRCFPTSVFGYIDQNGCVNYSYSKDTWLIGDPELRQSLNMSAFSSTDPDNDVVTSTLFRYWRPMLTIDPFLYAVFGEDRSLGVPINSHYMFRLSELFGGDDTEADAGARQRRKGGLFSWGS